MKIFECKESPIKVFGLMHFYDRGTFCRLPEEIMEKLPQLRQFGSLSVGGRIAFRTNSKNLYVKLASKTFRRDYAATQIASSGLNIFSGDRREGNFIGSVFPLGYAKTDNFHSEATFALSGEMTDITMFMPKNEEIENVFIGIDDDAVLEAPTPYENEKPVIFYGSSITEGGSAGRTGNAYNAMLSRALNMDYINFGFSGNAKGEPEMAEFIADLPMSIFVYDYDYNAPDVEHLEKTHEPFFKIIREKNPDLPIIMLSRPNYACDPEESEKRIAVIRRTYENALAKGDKNVYFINGKTFFNIDDVFACTVDRIHPNDLGCYLMAKEIRKTLEPIFLKAVEKERAERMNK